MPQQPIKKYQVGIDIPVKRNVVINGNFEIWQRGTSFPSIATVTYSVDRWEYDKIGSAVHTISRSTDVPTVAQAGRLFNFSLQLALTTADTTIAAGDRVHIVQRVEGYNFLPLAQQPMTLSFWVKAGISGTYCAVFANSGLDRSYVAEYTINAANTWEYKTITVLASPSAGTWDYTNGVGLRVRFILAAGTTFQTTPNVWQTGDFYATSNQVNGVNTGAGNFLITGVQLESGKNVTPIEQRPFNEELLLCQRYYEKSYELDTAPGTATSVSETHFESTGHNSNSIVSFKATKRILPAVSSYSSTGAINRVRNNSASVNLFDAGHGISIQNFVLTIVSGTAPIGDELGAHWTADAEL